MALTSEPHSCIQPFWHIDCPVCGGENFTEMGTGGGVWCDECNAEFKVRGTSGDPGCVVDCFIGDVHNIAHHNGDKTRWRTALMDLDCYRDEWRNKTPKVYAYRIMKEPGGDDKGLGTYCTDDRGWILSLCGGVLDKDVPDVVMNGESQYKYLTEPMVTREVALACGERDY
jgi:hypothetical protein